MKRYTRTILICLSLFLAVLALYESMAPQLLSSANYGSDGGDYLAAVLTNGIPHPTGYPLYLLLSWPIQRIFSSTPVWKQAQLSILPGALIIALLFAISTFFADSKAKSMAVVAGLAACIALATAPLFWSQSIIVEVYALNLLFVTLGLIWYLLAIRDTQTLNHSKISLVVLAWGCGLGLGNHVTFVLIYPLVLIGLWHLYKAKVNKWIVFLCAIGWLSGLFTYLILPLRAMQHPPVNWGNPETLSGLLWLISGGPYRGNLFGISLQEYPTRIAAWVSLFFTQFGIFGMLAGFWGIIDAKVSPLIKRSTVYLFFVYSIFAIGYKTNDSLVYLLPTLLVFALWISWGILTLWKVSWRKINIGLVLAIVIAINVIVVSPARYRALAPNSADLAQYAEETLTQASENAMVYPDSDGQTFALWYYQYGLGLRPDVKIISRGLLQYPWYRESLLYTYPNLTANDLKQSYLPASSH